MNGILHIDKNNVVECIRNNIILIALIRNSRLKCKRLAILELLQILKEYKVAFIKNPPLGDVKGTIAFALSVNDRLQLEEMKRKLNGTGYTHRFYILNFENIEQCGIISINPQYWKGRPFTIEDFFEQDNDEFRNQAADKRTFKLICADGIARDIVGYRGDGTDTGKRALPVEDCRLLVNLSCNYASKQLLDPFCGAGGIVFQAKHIYSDLNIFSCDIASELSEGNKEYGAEHFVCPAEELTLPNKVDAISTEVPFSENASKGVAKGFINLSKYMDDNCKITIMCTPTQTQDLVSALSLCNIRIGAVIDVDRKGTDVQIIIAFNNESDYTVFQDTWKELQSVF